MKGVGTAMLFFSHKDSKKTWLSLMASNSIAKQVDLTTYNALGLGLLRQTEG